MEAQELVAFCPGGKAFEARDCGENETFTQADDHRISRRKRCCACCDTRSHSKKRRKLKSHRINRRQRTGNTLLHCCKKTLAFFFSHVGLCSLVVGYSIAGGFIFSRLEAPYEATQLSNVESRRRHHVTFLWNLTEELNILEKENWTAIANIVLKRFQQDVYRAIKERGWNGRDDVTELQWSYTGALLYSVTVITTIGYGHIAPKTSEGRLVTIFYALVGIPLTLLCLANLGSLFGDCFRLFYKYICQFITWLCCPPKTKNRTATIQTDSTQRHKHELSRDANEMYPLRRCNIAANTDNTDTGEEFGNGDDKDVNWEITCNPGEEILSGINHTVHEDHSNHQVAVPNQPIRVPICVSILLIAVYIFGGAVLFTLWEENWDYLISSYFCFITLSTIGFGDFVPGVSYDSWANQEKAVYCALYLVFGLSLIAMCFNLMQEEVRAKVRWLAEKIRLVDDEEKI